MSQRRPWTLLTCILLATAVQNAVAEGYLRLRLDSDSTVMHAGGDAMCVLSIEGDAVREVVTKTPGIIWDKELFGKPSGFRLNFRIHETMPGQFTLGPYNVDFQGKKLTSNPLSIIVLPNLKDDPNPQPRLTLSRSTIKLGESVSGLLDLITNPQAPFSQITFEDSLAARQTGISTIQSFHDGSSTQVTSQNFIFTPKTRGRFVLSPTTIKNLPKGSHFPEKTLVVD